MVSVEWIFVSFTTFFIPCWSSRRQNNVTAPDCSNGLYLDGILYERTTLFNHTGNAFNLVLHKYSGTLFFSYTVKNQTHVDFKIAACSLPTGICKDVPGIPGGYAVAYDFLNDDIYFGGHDGIYKYSFIANEAEFFAEDGKSILDIFVKKHFYYILYPSLRLYVYDGVKFVLVEDSNGLKIERFFISANSDVYFSNETGLCKVEKQTLSVIFLSDEVKVRQLAQDKYGDIYIASDQGIYVEMNPGYRMKKLVHIDNIYGLTFDDNDDMIYSDSKGVYRLTQSKNAVHCHFRRKYNLFLGS